nr:hypothetical protein [uncultured Draconibacterium sp.]
MKVKEFLKAKNVDIDSNKSVLANQLKADLSTQGHYIDFNKDINDLTEEDKYQIGRSLILPDFKGIPFQRIELIKRIESDINELKSE